MKSLTTEKSNQRWVYETMDFGMGELLLQNIRHVQHPADQLKLILREVTHSAPSWVRKIKMV